MTEELFDMKTAKVGDMFSCIFYHQYGRGVLSAYNYKVIRAGKRDIVCNVFKSNGGLVNKANGFLLEERFKRDEHYMKFYPLNYSKIIEARKQIARQIKLREIRDFLSDVKTEKYDDEFIAAVEAFKKRVEETK